MTDRLPRAVANNLAWCALVTPAGGVTDPTVGVWTTTGPPPALFPDAVTLRPGVSAGAVAAALADRPTCAVKDSFADVELGAHGFEPLFEARWIGMPPAAPGASGWPCVQDARTLTLWSAAAGLPDGLPETLLADPSVRVLVRRRHGAVVAGAVLNRSDGVAGVTNVFGAGGSAWNGLGAAAAQHFPGLPLVGYEHGPDLDAALGAGFDALGPVRVWVRA